jgi:hypothetical protein
MPVGSFAPSMLEEPMARETMLIIKRAKAREDLLCSKKNKSPN